MWSRQIGKTYAWVSTADEECRRGPNRQVKYGCPTLKQAKRVVYPTMQAILHNPKCPCPPDLVPKWHAMDMVWEYPNGSILTLFGCDHEAAADSGRGTKLDAGFLDEAGFIPILDYVLKDVMMPQTVTTGGPIALLTSPPVSPAHPFVDIYRECERAGRSDHRTIEVAEKYIGRPEIERLVEAAGGRESVAARREYYAEIVTDATRAIVPEARDDMFVERERPEYCNKYVVGDFGHIDLTVVLFAYYDFMRGKLYVEDELVLERASAAPIADAVLAKEKQIWADRSRIVRLADSDLMVLQDIVGHNGLQFGTPNKADADASLNSLRMAILRGDIEAHPRCKTLWDHLKYGVWNEKRTAWERIPGRGHFDAIAALMYLWRHVDRQSNPFPIFDSSVKNATHWIRDTTAATSTKRREDMKRAFGV
jgi:hypothetical protein